MLYDKHQIANYYPQAIITEGEELIASSGVSNLQVRNHGASISALVQDGADQERVFVDIKPQATPLFKVDCSCETHDCAHSVAVLLAALSVESEKPRKPSFLDKMRAKHQQIAAPNQKLIYFLSVAEQPSKPELIVDLAVQDQHPDGRHSVQPYFFHSRQLGQPPRFLEEVDTRILHWLLNFTNKQAPQERFQLSALTDLALLERLLSTGRCYFAGTEFKAKPVSPLRWHESVNASAQWLIETDGTQQLALVPDQQIRLMPGPRPFYLSPEDLCLGPIHTGLSDQALVYIDGAPRLPVEQVSDFIGRQRQHLEQRRLPLPQQIQIELFDGGLPQPELKFYSKRTYAHLTGGQSKPVVVDAIRLQFRYDAPAQSLVFENEDPHSMRRQLFEGVLYQIDRDKAAEQQCRQDLLEAIPQLQPVQKKYDLDWDADIQPGDLLLTKSGDWQSLFQQQLDQFKTRGWQLQIAPDFRFHFAEVESWYGDVADDRDDWFSLELGILVEGERVNLLPQLASFLERVPLQELHRMDEETLISFTLEDGRIVSLRVERLRKLATILIELSEQPQWDDEGRLQLGRPNTSRLGEMALACDDADMRWQGDLELLQRARHFQSLHQGKPITLPADFSARLRDYQSIGVSWLQNLREQGVGGILADDMGLGKTIQTLAHIAIEKSAGRLTGPVLVVAPTSLINNWLEEAKKFTPALRCCVLHGPNRNYRFREIGQHDLLITTYHLILKDIDFWRNQPVTHLILDEAHVIKNSQSKISRAVKQLDANHRLCLTGTPMENHLGELWSLYDFLLPGFLNNESQFKAEYRNPIERDGDTVRAQALFNRIAPFILRRTKNEVATELPPKTEVVCHIPLSDTQNDLYETIRATAREGLQQAIAEDGISQSRIKILDTLLKLRQVCCDPKLTKLTEAQTIPSAKLEHLTDMVTELVDEGRRILIFSQFTSMLELIANTLDEQQLNYVTLTGATRDRSTVVEKFQSGEVPLFLISLKAGGVGLNLTAADTVIHYDPWWNPAAEQQASDRAYRIGQDKPVFIYKLLTENTVEQKIYQLQQQKLDLMSAVYDAAEQQSSQFSISSEELLEIIG